MADIRFGPNPAADDIWFGPPDAVAAAPTITETVPAAPTESAAGVIIRGNNFSAGMTITYAGLAVSVQNFSAGTGPGGEDEFTVTWPTLAVAGQPFLRFNTDYPLIVDISAAFQVQTAPQFDYGITMAKGASRAGLEGMWDDDTLVVGTDFYYGQSALPPGVEKQFLSEGFLNGIPGTVLGGGTPSLTWTYLLGDVGANTWSNASSELFYQGSENSLTFFGAGDLTLTPRLILQGAVNFSGSATLSADGRLVTQGGLAFIGGSQLSLNARLQADVPGQITFAGSSAFSSAPRQSLSSSIQFAGGSQLALSPGLQNAAVLLAGTSDLQIDGRLIAAGGLLFQGSSTLALTPRLDVFLRTSVTFDGTSTLALAPLLVGGARLTFDGGSALAASARQILRENVLFAGVSTLRLEGIIPGNDIGDIDVPGVTSGTIRNGITSRHNW